MNTAPDVNHNSDIVQYVKYDLNEHINYVLGVMNLPEHGSWGLSTALEAIDNNMPDKFDFNPEYFSKRFAIFLEKNDVIRRATTEEVDALSARIIAKFGRNYRLVDLIKSWQNILRAWEVQTGSLD